MARYFAPGEQLTYDDYLSLKAELFGELETYLEERFNIAERLDDLEEDSRTADRQLEKIEERLEAIEDSFPADLEESA